MPARPALQLELADQQLVEQRRIERRVSGGAFGSADCGSPAAGSRTCACTAARRPARLRPAARRAPDRPSPRARTTNSRSLRPILGRCPRGGWDNPAHARVARGRSHATRALADRIARRPGARRAPGQAAALAARRGAASAASAWRVGAVSRRGKYLWLPLQGAKRQRRPAVHLGMSGSLALARARGAAARRARPLRPRHQRRARCASPTRAASARWCGRDALRRGAGRASCSPGWALEPFDAALRRRRICMPRCAAPASSIKPALLAGDIVVGAGNIYACEALFRAGIDPRTRSDRLSRPRCERLAAGVARHAGRARRARRLDAARLPRRARHGRRVPGRSARVYGRAGQPCPSCGTARCAASCRASGRPSSARAASALTR